MPRRTKKATNSPQTPHGVGISELLVLGWYQKANGKEVAIHWQSVNGDIGYRYKGTKQIRHTSRASFLKRFANYNGEHTNTEVSEGGTRDSRIETAAQSRPSLH